MLNEVLLMLLANERVYVKEPRTPSITPRLSCSTSWLILSIVSLPNPSQCSLLVAIFPLLSLHWTPFCHAPADRCPWPVARPVWVCIERYSQDLSSFWSVWNTRHTTLESPVHRLPTRSGDCDRWWISEGTCHANPVCQWWRRSVVKLTLTSITGMQTDINETINKALIYT